MNYPHIGFKILCGIWGFYSLRYMQTNLKQNKALIEQNRTIINKHDQIIKALINNPIVYQNDDIIELLKKIAK